MWRKTLILKLYPQFRWYKQYHRDGNSGLGHYKDSDELLLVYIFKEESVTYGRVCAAMHVWLALQPAVLKLEKVYPDPLVFPMLVIVIY